MFLSSNASGSNVITHSPFHSEENPPPPLDDWGLQNPDGYTPPGLDWIGRESNPLEGGNLATVAM